MPSLHHLRLALSVPCKSQGYLVMCFLHTYAQSCFGARVLSVFLLDTPDTTLFLVCLRGYEFYQDFMRTVEKIHYKLHSRMCEYHHKKTPQKPPKQPNPQQNNKNPDALPVLLCDAVPLDFSSERLMSASAFSEAQTKPLGCWGVPLHSAATTLR